MRFILLFAFALLSLASLPVLISHRFVDYDDFAIVDPLRTVSTISDYKKAIDKNEIFDRSPVRDFTYWAEIQVEKAVGFANFQLTNLILWFCAIGVFFFCLRLLNVEAVNASIVSAIICLHPLLHASVFWIAGRKHLLSALFILLSLIFLLLYRKTNRKKWLFYSFLSFPLALFSQPINIGFSVFVAVFLYREGRLKAARVYVLAMFAVSLLVAWINVVYFSGEAYLITGGHYLPKFMNFEWLNIEKRILIFGRDVFQILLPIRPAIGSYAIFRPESYVGLVLLIAAAFAIFKYCGRNWLWLLFAFLPISVVTVNLTAQGGMDTYLLTALFGIGFFVATAFQFPKAVCLGLLIVFAFINFCSATAWSSSEKLWTYAYESEPSFSSRLAYVEMLSNKEGADQEEIWRLANECYEENKSNQLGYVLGKSIFAKKLSFEEKERLFSSYDIHSPWFAYYRSAAMAQAGRYGEGADVLDAAWKADTQSFLVFMRFYLDELESKWTKMCELAGRGDCALIKQKIEAAQDQINHRF